MDASDEQLVQRCVEELPFGTLAFEELVRRYEPIVYSTCLRYLNDHQEAEETCQDAFMRVFHALKKFEGKSTFRTWLFRIVTNACATRYAKIKRRQEVLRSVREEAENSGRADTSAPKLNDAEISGPLGEALEQLADSDRQILLLRHIAELSLQEISETLELKLSAAKMRLTRAQKRLREKYQDNIQQDPEN